LEDDALLTAAEANYAQRLNAAGSRFDSVNGRLIPLLSLAAVLATAASVTAPILVDARVSSYHDPILLLAAPIAYSVVQLVRCLHASVNGLRRQTLNDLHLSDLDPLAGETPRAYRGRILERRRFQLLWNEWATDKKVTDMEIAHVAFLNGLFGLGAVIITTLAVFATQVGTSNDSAAGSHHSRPAGWNQPRQER